MYIELTLKELSKERTVVTVSNQLCLGFRKYVDYVLGLGFHA